MSMIIRPNYQTRAIDEKSDLDNKIAKLRAFIEEKGIYLELPATEQNLMSEQLAVMSRYSIILDLRIKAFT